MDIESFNPHTHAGCDSFTAVTLQVGEVSIHTPTQGVTFGKGFIRGTIGFNPHTHAGCDGSKVCITVLAHVSIHTPTQGVTSPLNLFQIQSKVSIHTPTQGVTYINICVIF